MRRVLYVMALLLPAGAVAMSAGGAAAAMCALDSERAAAEARVVQTELMVAALTCDRRAEYNRFVKKFQPQLVNHGKTLRAYFRRVHGKKGEARVTRFVTRLANDASARSIEQGTAAFCASAAAQFEEALALDRKDLSSFVRNHPSAQAHGIEPCPREAARTR